MAQPVVLREFSYRADAEIVREFLAANGIEAFVNSDDCGSVDPALQFARGVQLMVAEEDRAPAERAIAAGAAGADTEPSGQE